VNVPPPRPPRGRRLVTRGIVLRVGLLLAVLAAILWLRALSQTGPPPATEPGPGAEAPATP